MFPGYQYSIQIEAFQCVKIYLQLGKSREVTTVESEPKIR